MLRIHSKPTEFTQKRTEIGKNFQSAMYLSNWITVKLQVLARLLRSTHWPILGWNVSKSWLQKVDFFENYAIVAIQIDNANFYACKIIKALISRKQFFSARRCHHPKNSWNIFQIQIPPLFWRLQTLRGV